jgi:hypothetical protein
VRWVVQWALGYVPKKKRRWVTGWERDTKEECVELLKDLRNSGKHHVYRLVCLVTPSEKLRAAIVKELRTIAEEHALYTGVDEAWVHSSETLSAVADRIERGEVG